MFLHLYFYFISYTVFYFFLFFVFFNDTATTEIYTLSLHDALPIFITTADGSHSLLNTELQETYHSIHGALQESIHVFIQNGLQFFSEQDRKSTRLNSSH